MTEARRAILIRAVVAGMVVSTGTLGCGGGSPAKDASAPDASAPDTAIDARIVDAPAPVTPDAAPPDVTPDLARDVREWLTDAAIPCSDGGTCEGTGTCCSGICIDLSKDPRNCGACGKACTASQFCTGLACTDAVFANVCANPSAVVITDPYPADNGAAAAIGMALAASCMPPTMLMTREQGEPGVLSASGRPLAGSGTSYLIGGGNFGQHAVDYLDKTDMTPVYLTGDSMKIELHNRGSGEVVLSAPNGSLNEGHDFFYVQMFVEPLSGTLCVNAIGMYAAGTVAGGFWLSTEIIPKRAMYTDTWYAYEWTDDGDKIPNAADTFRLVAHGR